MPDFTHGKWWIAPPIAWECSLCHEVWQLMDGTPAENGMNYCQYCGAEMTMLDTEAMNAPQ